ncbi:hypothetical protein [Microvirga terricola]|uniref:Uncharacterized protein n=1 Tax=Microvirga terricola TaxID=2719797 RepID=A0ABX0VBY5_9HYPH|nr:hypothetical protein [Microvirga terricola]NIX77364.1 hypothetical protein [Microvirga terricola]
MITNVRTEFKSALGPEWTGGRKGSSKISLLRYQTPFGSNPSLRGTEACVEAFYRDFLNDSDAQAYQLYIFHSDGHPRTPYQEKRAALPGWKKFLNQKAIFGNPALEIREPTLDGVRVVSLFAVEPISLKQYFIGLEEVENSFAVFVRKNTLSLQHVMADIYKYAMFNDDGTFCSRINWPRLVCNEAPKIVICRARLADEINSYVLELFIGHENSTFMHTITNKARI